MRFIGKWLAGGREDPARAAADAVARAFSLCQAGEHAAAERMCRDLLEAQPGHSGALHCLGVIALREDRVSEAVGLLEQAITRDNADLQIRYDLAEAYRLGQRWQDASLVYRLVVEARPQVVEARIGLAESLSSLGELAGAREQCEQVLVSEPGNRRALMLAADLALHDQAPAGAELALGAALAREPDNAGLQQGMARVLVDRGETARAAPLLRGLLAAGSDAAHYTLVRLVESAVRLDQPPLSPSPPSPPAATGADPLISIIICSVDESKYRAVTAHYAQLLAGERFEIIGIHDAKSLCEGYNRGVRRAGGDLLVFSHDDIEILTPDFAARLKRHLERHHVVGACGTSRLVRGYWMAAQWPYLHGLVAHHYPADYRIEPDKAGKYRVMVFDTSAEASTGLMQGLDGMFIAARREVVESCPFDEERFRGFHLYDLDFTFAAYLAGFDVAVFRDITMVHYTYAAAEGYADAQYRDRKIFEEKYRRELSPALPDGRRFLPAVFDDKAQVARFCSELMAFRRSAVSAEMRG